MNVYNEDSGVFFILDLSNRSNTTKSKFERPYQNSRKYCPICEAPIYFFLPLHADDMPLTTTIIRKLSEEMGIKLIIIQVRSNSNSFAPTLWKDDIVKLDRPQQFVIIIGSRQNELVYHHQIEFLVHQLDQKVSMNHSALITSVIYKLNAKFNALFKHTFRYALINSIIICPVSNGKELTVSRTYNPYDEVYCQKSFGIYVVDQWDMGNGSFMNELQLLFGRLVPSKYYTCQLKYNDFRSIRNISFFEYFEAQLFMYFGEFYDFETTIDMTGGFLGGGLSLSSTLDGTLTNPTDISYPHYSTKIKWYIPCPRSSLGQGHEHGIESVDELVRTRLNLTANQRMTYHLLCLAGKKDSQLCRKVTYGEDQILTVADYLKKENVGLFAPEIIVDLAIRHPITVSLYETLLMRMNQAGIIDKMMNDYQRSDKLEDERLNRIIEDMSLTSVDDSEDSINETTVQSPISKALNFYFLIPTSLAKYLSIFCFPSPFHESVFFRFLKTEETRKISQVNQPRFLPNNYNETEKNSRSVGTLNPFKMDGKYSYYFS
ncbi:hypothetical protein C0J52_26142 [Blattella germanica]|nr:hypothetical protein C0J52_26142 [Blattella germanica]